MKVSERLMAIYDAALSEDRWTAALDAMQQGTKTAGIMFYSNNANRPVSYHASDVSSSYSWISSHLPDYNKLVVDPEVGTNLDDEGFAYMHLQPAFQPVRDDEIWTIDNDHLSRAEIRFTIQRLKFFRRFFLNLSDDPLTFSALLCHYPAHFDQIPFEADMRQIGNFAPHFGKALEMSRLVSSLRHKHRAVLAALDQVDAAMCVIGRKGHVILHNRCAASLFALRGGIWLSHDGRLSCRNSDDLAQLNDALHRIAKTASGENTDCSIKVPIQSLEGQAPLFAIASPLRDADMELERGLTGALLTIIDGSESRAIDLDLIAAAYQLARSEKRVLTQILEGRSNTEISEALGVSPETVKTHVSSILRKTNCKNRLLLLWRVFQWAPPVI